MSSSLVYTRSGSGAPLVLLHPLGLSRRSWNPVIPALARHFDVIAVDLPGFGDSPATAQAHPAALAEAVAGLLAELGVTTPHVAGNSLGGWVAPSVPAPRPASARYTGGNAAWLRPRADDRRPRRRRRAHHQDRRARGSGPGRALTRPM